jgi:hypothetical protein
LVHALGPKSVFVQVAHVKYDRSESSASSDGVAVAHDGSAVRGDGGRVAQVVTAVVDDGVVTGGVREGEERLGGEMEEEDFGSWKLEV